MENFQNSKINLNSNNNEQPLVSLVNLINTNLNNQNQPNNLLNTNIIEKENNFYNC